MYCSTFQGKSGLILVKINKFDWTVGCIRWCNRIIYGYCDLYIKIICISKKYVSFCILIISMTRSYVFINVFDCISFTFNFSNNNWKTKYKMKPMFPLIFDGNVRRNLLVCNKNFRYLLVCASTKNDVFFYREFNKIYYYFKTLCTQSFLCVRTQHSWNIE